MGDRITELRARLAEARSDAVAKQGAARFSARHVANGIAIELGSALVAEVPVEKLPKLVSASEDTFTLEIPRAVLADLLVHRDAGLTDDENAQLVGESIEGVSAEVARLEAARRALWAISKS